ncbi:hypothetical protein ADUPG1_008604, partial [Aduncisulcus paluster]
MPHADKIRIFGEGKAQKVPKRAMTTTGIPLHPLEGQIISSGSGTYSSIKSKITSFIYAFTPLNPSNPNAFEIFNIQQARMAIPAVFQARGKNVSYNFYCKTIYGTITGCHLMNYFPGSSVSPECDNPRAILPSQKITVVTDKNVPAYVVSSECAKRGRLAYFKRIDDTRYAVAFSNPQKVAECHREGSFKFQFNQVLHGRIHPVSTYKLKFSFPLPETPLSLPPSLPPPHEPKEGSGHIRRSSQDITSSRKSTSILHDKQLTSHSATIRLSRDSSLEREEERKGKERMKVEQIPESVRMDTHKQYDGDNYDIDGSTHAVNKKGRSGKHGSSGEIKMKRRKSLTKEDEEEDEYPVE